MGHDHAGYPLWFDDDDCPICDGRVGPWPEAVAPCGCNPVTDCAKHRAEKEAKRG